MPASDDTATSVAYKVAPRIGRLRRCDDGDQVGNKNNCKNYCMVAAAALL